MSRTTELRQALAVIVQRDVSRETLEQLDAYAALLGDENRRQNLVADATPEVVWQRHILDSAQLARFEPAAGSSWVDVGSGAGLPGIVLACLVSGPVTLIEPRRLRAEFLHKVVELLGLNASVQCARVERIEGPFDVITGRAVASLHRFLEISAHLSTRNSIWALPKGRKAAAELAEARRTWQGDFRLEASVTDPTSFVVIASKVKAKRS